MTRDEALHALGLDVNVSPVDIERALLDRVAQLEQRISVAPTDALKQKYKRQLSELEEARTALLGGGGGSRLSETMMADLPMAQAAYTRGAVGPNTATGLSLKSGQILAARYQIEEQIGVGGMGAVYRAFDKNRDKDIAIKVLLPQLLSSPKARERFLNEARLSSEMSHPNIVTVFDVQQDGPYTFLTMELLRGQTLRQYLSTLIGLRKTMPVEEALRIADDVCRGLAYAHERTIHRDIKPENVWLTEDGKAKVTDFGIARLVTTTQMTQTMMALGTAYYMAPEQLAGRADIDGRADQYSVAVMVYEMLAGAVPTGRMESLAKLRKDVPRSVSMAVDRALSPKAEQRFSTMEAFRQDLHKPRVALAGATAWWIGGGVAAVLVAAGVAIALPGLKSLIPDREAEIAARAQVASLQAETKSLLRLVDTQRREIHDAALNAGRDVERIDGQFRSARSAEEKADLQTKLLVAKDAMAVATESDGQFKVAVEGKDGLTVQEGKLGEADNLLKAGQLTAARDTLLSVKHALTTLKGKPEETRLAMADAREKLIGRVEGRWAAKSCDDAASWVVKGQQFQVLWPNNPVFEERVIAVTGNQIWTSVTSPANYRGRLSAYKVSTDTLEVFDQYAARSEKLKKCSG